MPRLQRIAGGIALCAVVACGREVTTAPFVEFRLEADPAPLTGTVVAQAVTGEPRVRVLRGSAPAAGVAVRFVVLQGNGSVSNAVDTSDAQGWASAGTWTAGTLAGAQRLLAFIPTSGSAVSVEYAVTAAPGAAASATITPAYTPLAAGGSAALTATLRDQYGNVVVPTAPVSWTSLQPSVATVTGEGSVSAVAAGWTQVVFSAAGQLDTAYVGVAGTLPAYSVDSALFVTATAVGAGAGGQGLQGNTTFDVETLASGTQLDYTGSVNEIAVTPGTDVAWMIDQVNSRLIKVDVAAAAILDTIALPAPPTKIRPSADGSLLYVATTGGVLLRVNATTHAVTSSPLGGNHVGLSVSPLGDALFVINATGGLLRVSTATMTITHALQIGGGPQDVLVSDDGQRLYVTRNTGFRLFLARDLSTLATIATLTGGSAMQEVANGQLLLLSTPGTAALRFMDPFTLGELGTRSTGNILQMARIPGSGDVLLTQGTGRLFRLRF